MTKVSFHAHKKISSCASRDHYSRSLLNVILCLVISWRGTQIKWIIFCRFYPFFQNVKILAIPLCETYVDFPLFETCVKFL